MGTSSKLKCSILRRASGSSVCRWRRGFACTVADVDRHLDEDARQSASTGTRRSGAFIVVNRVQWEEKEAGSRRATRERIHVFVRQTTGTLAARERGHNKILVRRMKAHTSTSTAEVVLPSSLRLGEGAWTQAKCTSQRK